MYVKYIVLLAVLTVDFCKSIYPYFDTQDFIYNVPKVYRISITLDKLLEYYEKKPSKDPEWYIALGMARGIHNTFLIKTSSLEKLKAHP